jgi:hypothetical protein
LVRSQASSSSSIRLASASLACSKAFVIQFIYIA